MFYVALMKCKCLGILDHSFIKALVVECSGCMDNTRDIVVLLLSFERELAGGTAVVVDALQQPTGCLDQYNLPDALLLWTND